MEITIHNSSEVPIYEQITSQIKQLILNGELESGRALPSPAAAGEGTANQRDYDETGL